MRRLECREVRTSKFDTQPLSFAEEADYGEKVRGGLLKFADSVDNAATDSRVRRWDGQALFTADKRCQIRCQAHPVILGRQTKALRRLWL